MSHDWRCQHKQLTIDAYAQLALLNTISETNTEIIDK